MDPITLLAGLLDLATTMAPHIVEDLKKVIDAFKSGNDVLNQPFVQVQDPLPLEQAVDTRVDADIQQEFARK
jgi:hypothetical protein